MPDRKYALMKIARGDYLLPSNDARTIYRLRTYEDGPSHGIEHWPRDLTFWGVSKWIGRGEAVDPDIWDAWEMVESQCRTRGEAIQAALRMGDA